MGAILALILTISSVSGTTINSPDDVLTVYAAASGLQNKQYLQVVFTKEGEKSNYFGFTQNLSNEWYQYKSSPTDDDLSSYFYNFTPVSGTWSGQLNVKMDPQDDGFKGSGNYILKIFKPTSSSSSTNSATIVINVSLPATNSSTSAVVDLPTPVIEFTVPATANLGESFKTTADLKNFAANTEFYLKIRDKVQTKNGNNFLSDNEAWNFFPLIKTDSSGNWSGEIWGSVSEEKDTGVYKIKLRARKKDTDSFFESDIKEIKLAKIIAPVAIVATPAVKLKTENIILGTESASVSSFSKQPKEKEKTKFDRLSLAILVSGGIFSLAGIYGIIKRAL